MSSSSEIPAGLYEKEIVGNNIYLSMKYPKMLKRDRVKIAMAHQPSQLDLNRPWTAADEAASDFTHVNDQQHVYLRCKVSDETIDHTHMKFVSAAQNIASGHLPDLVEIQKYLLNKSWRENALDAQDNKKEDVKNRGSTFDSTFSTEPGNKDGCIHISKVAKDNLTAHNDCVRRPINIMTSILKEHLAGEVSLQHQEIRWAVKASITAGDQDNQWLSHIRVNVSDLPQGLQVSLKRAGHAHFDKNDECTLWSVLLFLSHFPDNYHPGIMSVYSTRVCAPCETYGALIFTGTHPHSGSGKGLLPADYIKPTKPPGTELELARLPPHLPYTRLHAVEYPRNNNIEARITQVNQELGQPFALGAFGTALNRAEWKLRAYIKHHIEVIRPDPQYWVDRFAFYDEFGWEQKPRLFIAQLCFDHAKVAWLDHPEHKKLHKAILAAGVGTTLPPDESVPKKESKVRRKRALGEPIEKDQCDGLTTRGKQCKKVFQPKLDGNTRCEIHSKKKKSSDITSSFGRNLADNGNSSSNLKRTIDEREALERVIDPDLENDTWGEGAGGFGWLDETPGLREYYAGLQYRGYGEEEEEEADAAAPQVYQGPVGIIDVSGLYEDEDE